MVQRTWLIKMNIGPSLEFVHASKQGYGKEPQKRGIFCGRLVTKRSLLTLCHSQQPSRCRDVQRRTREQLLCGCFHRGRPVLAAPGCDIQEAEFDVGRTLETHPAIGRGPGLFGSSPWHDSGPGASLSPTSFFSRLFPIRIQIFQHLQSFLFFRKQMVPILPWRKEIRTL